MKPASILAKFSRQNKQPFPSLFSALHLKIIRVTTSISWVDLAVGLCISLSLFKCCTEIIARCDNLLKITHFGIDW